MSGKRRTWWLDMAGYDADAWRWLVEGVDSHMGRGDQVAYLRTHLDAVARPWDDTSRVEVKA
ncbi:MAG: hypothetical protein GEV10_23650 [Streptosporangiales bacterium]|nr:hypothetical protein [Streptosporangiales bacterium]